VKWASGRFVGGGENTKIPFMLAKSDVVQSYLDILTMH